MSSGPGEAGSWAIVLPLVVSYRRADLTNHTTCCVPVSNNGELLRAMQGGTKPNCGRLIAPMWPGSPLLRAVGAFLARISTCRVNCAPLAEGTPSVSRSTAALCHPSFTTHQPYAAMLLPRFARHPQMQTMQLRMSRVLAPSTIPTCTPGRTRSISAPDLPNRTSSH